MRNFTTNLLLACSTLIFMGACSDERVEEDELNSYESMNDYLDSKKQEEQVFTIDTTGDGPLIGKEGTRIWGGKDLLMFPNGDSVTWPYTVTLVELYNGKDMAYYEMPTVAGGELMRTRGEIRLRAFKDGEELVLRPGKNIVVEMPSDDALAGLSVFYGSTQMTYTDWTNDPTTLGTTPVGAGTFTASDSSHIGQVDVLGWVNAGDSQSDGSGGVISFTSETDELDNVKIFAYIADDRTLIQAYDQKMNPIPDGTKVEILAMAIDASEQLFSFSKTITVSGDESVEVTLSEISDADLTALLTDWP